MSTAEYLHQRFCPRGDQISPVRIKGFKRKHLSLLFAELEFKRGAEIGVAEGYHSREICESVPGVELLCVDLWAPYKRGTALLKNQNMQDEAYEEAVINLAPYNARLIRDASDIAAHSVDDESLDFVYIDGDHSYEGAKSDIEVYWPKVKEGGLLAGHDYENKNVTRAVHEFKQANNCVLHVDVDPDDARTYDWWIIKGEKENFDEYEQVVQDDFKKLDALIMETLDA